MAYKPKYAAKKQQDIIRTQPPKQQKPVASPKPQSKSARIVSILLTIILVPLCSFATWKILGGMVQYVGRPKSAAIAKPKNMAVIENFDAYVAKRMEQAESRLSLQVVPQETIPAETEEERPPVLEHYTIPADALVAPEPNQALYGFVKTAAEMEPVLQKAKWLLDGQKTYFALDRELYERKDGENVSYYLDDTILAITWQEVHDDSVYTFSEIKVADASQFRRHMADGEYGSNTQYLTTEMAQTVNAVVATSGDFYRFRNFGAVVYQGQAKRVEGTYAETCYIDYNGDMHFTRGGEVLKVQDVQNFVDEHNINFSLAFGPILVDNYELQEHTWYGVGEINEGYARSALCQMDSLHYLIAIANVDGPHMTVPTVARFAKNIAATGCRMAYSLDGGQTAALVMNDKLINRPAKGEQRKISDIIYFATAIPEEGGSDNG